MPESENAFGLTKDVLKKIESKYDLDTEKECLEWIVKVTGKNFYTGSGIDFMTNALKDGVILCELLNKIKPETIKKINTSSAPFKQMENIENYLCGCKNLGVSPHELFQTVDLYEKKNPTQVLINIRAVGRRAQALNYSGPCLGPKEADKNIRNFSEEQLREGQSIIGLQMGTNRGANQDGILFGKRRGIND